MRRLLSGLLLAALPPAAVVFFLAASDFVTGQLLAVDGGLSQK